MSFIDKIILIANDIEITKMEGRVFFDAKEMNYSIYRVSDTIRIDLKEIRNKNENEE